MHEQIYVPIYRHTIDLFFVNDLSTVFEKYPTLEDSARNWDFRGFSCYNEDGVFVIIYREGKCDDKTVAHEIYHITHRILEHCGITYSESTEEAYAYLNGYITSQVKQQFNEWGIELYET